MIVFNSSYKKFLTDEKFHSNFLRMATLLKGFLFCAFWSIFLFESFTFLYFSYLIKSQNFSENSFFALQKFQLVLVRIFLGQLKRLLFFFGGVNYIKPIYEYHIWSILKIFIFSIFGMNWSRKHLNQTFHPKKSIYWVPCEDLNPNPKPKSIQNLILYIFV